MWIELSKALVHNIRGFFYVDRPLHTLSNNASGSRCEFCIFVDTTMFMNLFLGGRLSLWAKKSNRKSKFTSREEFLCLRI